MKKIKFDSLKKLNAKFWWGVVIGYIICFLVDSFLIIFIY